MMDTNLLGAVGESLAAQYYRKNGYEVLDNNYHTRQGELDVILQKDGIIVVLEVKTRSQNSIAAPREFVTAAKQRRIMLAAAAYLQEKGLTEHAVRFDVAAVTILGPGKADIHCIENAFTA